MSLLEFRLDRPRTRSMFFLLLAIKITSFVDKLVTLYFLDRNLTSLPLSQICYTFRRLYFSSLTLYTFLIECSTYFPLLTTPIIYPFSLTNWGTSLLKYFEREEVSSPSSHILRASAVQEPSMTTNSSTPLQQTYFLNLRTHFNLSSQ